MARVDDDNGIPLCYCGLPAELKMAWTDQNAGRRFYGCQNYGGNRYCRFRQWYDDPTPGHCILVIRGLLRRVDEAETEMKKSMARVDEVETEMKRMRWKKQKSKLEVQLKEVEVRKLRGRNRRMLALLLVSWVLFIWYLYV